MSWPYFIGGRYLHTRNKRSISVISAIAIAGVALGVASLLVVVSVTSGFQDEFTRKVLGVYAHVLITKVGGMDEYVEVMEKVGGHPSVRGVAPFVYQPMMISNGAKTSGVTIKGVDPTRIGSVLDLPEYMVDGGMDGLRVPGILPGGERKPGGDGALGPLPGIILGKSLAENIAAKVGDQVTVIAPNASLSLLGGAADQDIPSLPFTVAGIFYAGFHEYDTRLAYVDFYQAQRFFSYGDSVQGLDVKIADIHESGAVAAELSAMLGGPPFETLEWKTLNENLYTALLMQKIALMVIMSILVGVSAFNIIATLVMMVFDKRKEIAILKSMGASRREIATIFLYMGTSVGLVGILIGLAMGLGVCVLLQEIGWPLDPKVYLIDHLPVRIDPMDFVLTAGVAFVLCWLATLLPSLSAAKLRPVDGISRQ